MTAHRPADGALLPVEAGLFTVTGEVAMPGGVRLPLRTCVVVLADGVWVHAPLRLGPDAAAAIDALGPVRWLVAPNNLHHLWLEDAARRWPDAAVWVAPGVPAKHPGLRVAGVLGRDAPDWDRDVLDHVFVAGAPALDETVFLHRPSRTLLCTDLLFHVRPPASWRTRLMLTLTGTWNRFAQSRLWRVATKDRAAAARAAEAVLAWDFARVLPAHGEPVEVDAHARAEAALARMRAG